MSRYTIYHADVLDGLRAIADNSIDSVIGDPPGGKAFMGLDWDTDKGGREAWIAWMTQVCQECYRVLKPGGYQVFWAFPKTSHWTATAMEQAGFEIREKLYHLFGSGFPKSLNIGKNYESIAADLETAGAWARAEYYAALALRWQGWGTALKPSCEEWIIGRKPFPGTVLTNVELFGTGGLNIDGTRIAAEDRITQSGATETLDPQGVNPGYHRPGSSMFYSNKPIERSGPAHIRGRYPAHVVLSHHPDCVYIGTEKIPGVGPALFSPTALGQGSGWNDHANRPVWHPGFADEDGMETVERWACVPNCPVRILDTQSGMKRGTYRPPSARTRTQHFEGKGQHAGRSTAPDNYGDSGGATRYFAQFAADTEVWWKYLPKPGASEKNAGLDHLPARQTTGGGGGGRKHGLDNCGPNQAEMAGKYGAIKAPNPNHHPTVKGVTLMRWIARLVTPEGGTGLDPFMGSGSTGVALLEEGDQFIGIEANAEYVEIARARLDWAIRQQTETETGQQTMF